jgi:hypothetical protein
MLSLDSCYCLLLYGDTFSFSALLYKNQFLLLFHVQLELCSENNQITYAYILQFLLCLFVVLSKFQILFLNYLIHFLNLLLYTM